jgi:acetylornithine/succinyldiaminopimelate/putrescine aminotransferase
MNQRELFFRHLAPTSESPLALEIVQAEGCTLTDASGKTYIDLVGGISVANTGHRHPRVLSAITDQMQRYLHVMVYGEFVESPQVRYAARLSESLPPGLQSIYFTNSGTEAVEGAMKLAKRINGRPGIIAFHQSYHGSTQGSLSIMGDEYWRNAFRPLLPGVRHFAYNDDRVFHEIDKTTSCVIVETVQAESGVRSPDPAWLKGLKEACVHAGALLILDEVQAGFGRTGTLWGFEHFGIVPDILVLGKALGGGLPLGAFIASPERMSLLAKDPVLGHITTFGGHPLSCAAGLAAFEVLKEEKLVEDVARKAELFRAGLQHDKIIERRGMGLWFAVEMESAEICQAVIARCIENGVFVDWFLFAPHCIRISPPLTMSDQEIQKACDVLVGAANSI